MLHCGITNGDDMHSPAGSVCEKGKRMPHVACLATRPREMAVLVDGPYNFRRHFSIASEPQAPSWTISLSCLESSELNISYKYIYIYQSELSVGMGLLFELFRVSIGISDCVGFVDSWAWARHRSKLSGMGGAISGTCSLSDWGTDVPFGNHKHINPFLQLCLRRAGAARDCYNFRNKKQEGQGSMKFNHADPREWRFRMKTYEVCKSFLGLGIVNVRSSNVLTCIENLDLKLLPVSRRKIGSKSQNKVEARLEKLLKIQSRQVP